MRIYKNSGWMKLFYAKLAKAINNPAVYPLVLMIVGLAAYGTLIYHSGFYWDDWESVYLYFLHKPNISFQYFGERPFSTLIYLVLFPLVQMKPLTWFLISLFLRWTGVLGIYYAMNRVWPKRLYQNRWIGLILFVFPAFLQQPLSLCYSRHFSAFALFGLSLLFTVTAIKSSKRFWVWMISSVFLGLLQIFIIEYFVGLEILRPLFIWFALRSNTHEEKKTTLWKTVVLWSPFIIGLMVYFVWHFYYLPNFNGGMNPNNPVLIRSLIDTPGKTIILLSKHAAQDFWYTLFAVWANGFSADKFSFIHSKIAIIAWSLAPPTSILVGFYIKAASKEQDVSREDHFGQMLLLGLLAFVGGGIPYWVTNRQVNVGNWSDRFALAPIIGAAIIIVSVINWLIRTINQKQAFLIFQLLVTIVIQIFNTNVFQQDWLLQSNLYWQLAC
jgi:hypothetical protein